MTEAIPVLVLTREPLPEQLLAKLRAVSPAVEVRHRAAKRLEELDAGDWQGVQVLYSLGLLPQPEQAPDLRWVQAHSAGVNRWLGHPLLDRAMLTTASGIHAVAVGEHVLLMLLALAHQMPTMLRAQAAHQWAEDRLTEREVRELYGSTLAIVGYGSIGREVARLARALGMRVLARKRDVSQTADPGWRMPGTGDATGELVDCFYGPLDWHAMLTEADYIVVAAPLTASTRYLIDRRALQAMKHDAVLINVARGDLVDEAALIEALQAGSLRGAALDVFAQEPLPADSPLWDLPNVIISPHMAGTTPAYFERALTLFAENLRRYVAGEPLLNIVDRALEY